MTTFMEGTPFEVKSMQPADQAGVTPGRDENRAVTRVMVAAIRSFRPNPTLRS
jgi:hypothetical protein